jgi:hypothetical protein
MTSKLTSPLPNRGPRRSIAITIFERALTREDNERSIQWRTLWASRMRRHAW